MQLQCVLCDSKEKDEVIFGEFGTHERNTMHRNCLVLCLGRYVNRYRPQNRNAVFRLANFLRKEVLVHRNRFASIKCTYCHCLGANLACCHPGCQRKFHTKCGVLNMAVLQYGGRFDSYCAQHVPMPRNRPGPGESCVLCLGPILANGNTFSPGMAFQAPCCGNGWFHRDCVQDQSNGMVHHFRCPLCRNEGRYAHVAMLGVAIPKWRYTLPKPNHTIRDRVRNVIAGRYNIRGGPAGGHA